METGRKERRDRRQILPILLGRSTLVENVCPSVGEEGLTEITSLLDEEEGVVRKLECLVEGKL